MQRRSRRLKLLVVEPSRPWRNSLADLAADQPGIKLVRVSSAAAIGQVLEGKPDAILVGIATGEFSELEMLIFAKRRLPKVFVVAVAGRFSPGLQLKCLAAGADLLLARTEVSTRIPEILANLRRRHRHEGSNSLPASAVHPRVWPGLGGNVSR